MFPAKWHMADTSILEIGIPDILFKLFAVDQILKANRCHLIESW